MLLMFECRIRGGITTQAVYRYASVNNPYMGDQYNPSQESSYLQYLDANNQYGWAMSQPLPTGRFKWVDINPNEIRKLAARTDKRYLLEVKVSYLKDLHDSHNNLPFMCENLKISGIEKLIPNLQNKKNYIIHIPAPNQALAHGLITEKVHRAIEFDQSAWMKPYIDFKTQLRTKATNDFEKDFFMLMNNAIFGKTMENIRKHRNIRLVRNRERIIS